MPLLDVSDLAVLAFKVDTTIIAPNGGEWMLEVGKVTKIGRLWKTLDCSPSGDALCEYRDANGEGRNADVQAMRVDEVRTF